MSSAACPNCDWELELFEPLEGELTACPECGIDLEVKVREPLVLVTASTDPATSYFSLIRGAVSGFGLGTDFNCSTA